MVNENTILRLQALLEAYDCEAPAGSMSPGATDAEVAVRTLKYLRNLIPHKDHGLFRIRKGSPQWSAVERFALDHPAIVVPDGHPVCLDGALVLQPLADGLVEWAKAKGKL